MRWTIAVTAALLFGGPLCSQDKHGGVELKGVKFDALKELVHKNRGKVLVLDFWYNT